MSEPTYTMVEDPPTSMIGGWHVYRHDDGESAAGIVAQGVTREEASAMVAALNALAARAPRTYTSAEAARNDRRVETEDLRMRLWDTAKMVASSWCAATTWPPPPMSEIVEQIELCLSAAQRLTPKPSGAVALEIMSDESKCQACGESWRTHKSTCSGSAPTSPYQAARPTTALRALETRLVGALAEVRHLIRVIE